MNVMGVDFIAPVMMRGALFWILSRNCWLVFAVVDHAFELYSMTGLTDPSYTVLSICSLAPHVVPASLRMIASFLRAFPSVRKVCVFHVLACSFLHQLVLRTHTFLVDRLIHSYLTASDRPHTFLVDHQSKLCYSLFRLILVLIMHFLLNYVNFKYCIRCKYKSKMCYHNTSYLLKDLL